MTRFDGTRPVSCSAGHVSNTGSDQRDEPMSEHGPGSGTLGPRRCLDPRQRVTVGGPRRYDAVGTVPPGSDVSS